MSLLVIKFVQKLIIENWLICRCMINFVSDSRVELSGTNDWMHQLHLFLVGKMAAGHLVKEINPHF